MRTFKTRLDESQRDGSSFSFSLLISDCFASFIALSKLLCLSVTKPNVQSPQASSPQTILPTTQLSIPKGEFGISHKISVYQLPLIIPYAKHFHISPNFNEIVQFAKYVETFGL